MWKGQGKMKCGTKYMFLACFLAIIGAISAYLASFAIAEEGFAVRELSCINDGMTIYGKAYIPDRQGKAATVIMSHGFGGSYANNAEYAEAFAKAGIASYIFDFRGGSNSSRSGGSMFEMSVLTEADDLSAVVDFVKTLDFVDADNLFLMGCSQGGYVSALAAARRKGEVRGLMLLYPGFVIGSEVRRITKNGIPEQYEMFSSLDSTVGRKYFEDALKVDIYSEIKAYDKDVLILHGDKDGIVPLSYSEKATEVYASAELVVFKGAGHGFHGSDADLAIDKMVGYIASHSYKK
jgi:pimeloyl-ACP methyl ester carboxylesterase